MRKTYLISYDLKKPDQDYTYLIQELKKSNLWWHYLESTWLISTFETTQQIYQRIEKFIDKNDSVIIILVGKEYQGWLPEKAWNWIHNNV